MPRAINWIVSWSCSYESNLGPEASYHFRLPVSAALIESREVDYEVSRRVLLPSESHPMMDNKGVEPIGETAHVTIFDEPWFPSSQGRSRPTTGGNTKRLFAHSSVALGAVSRFPSCWGLAEGSAAHLFEKFPDPESGPTNYTDGSSLHFPPLGEYCEQTTGNDVSSSAPDLRGRRSAATTTTTACSSKQVV